MADAKCRAAISITREPKSDPHKEIGSALFISEGTVKSHVKAIFAKMNVISRTEAVASATRRGLIQL
ncbi:MAG: hypothetical protein DME54_00765 [Verrucomicrobia bacterium]|nr:MAG: hypothetical protein DME54_00765 [Verrucomicrobiota bacterium]PYL21609.1 MAG: hypothetical protein DMF41_01835 [Verrucomicrobiota bacterium]